VTVAAMGMTSRRPMLLVDLDGDLADVLGVAAGSGPGAHDWLRAGAPADRLDDLAVGVTHTTHLVPAGRRIGLPDRHRWTDLIDGLRAWERDHGGDVVIDAGTTSPPAELAQAVDRRLLITRACYLALRRAVRQAASPTGIVLVVEPGRALRVRDVEHTVGAPVVARIAIDPAIARAVDAGLLAGRMPVTLGKLRAVAA
jgi:hypothetical protein